MGKRVKTDSSENVMQHRMEYHIVLENREGKNKKKKLHKRKISCVFIIAE